MLHGGGGGGSACLRDSLVAGACARICTQHGRARHAPQRERLQRGRQLEDGVMRAAGPHRRPQQDLLPCKGYRAPPQLGVAEDHGAQAGLIDRGQRAAVCGWLGG